MMQPAHQTSKIQKGNVFMVQRFKALLVCALGAAALIPIGACESSLFGSSEPPKVDPNCTATVWVETADGEEVDVDIVLPKSDCRVTDLKLAVKHLQNDDFELARDVLVAYLNPNQENPDEPAPAIQGKAIAHYALAVALEELGEYQKAIDHYKKSNIINSNPYCTQGRYRCEDLLEG